MRVTRFAPSPTGLLHLGNLRTALLNFLLAKQEAGRFILRFDDTDGIRSKEKFSQLIREDLHWLGLSWDIEISQSDHLERYNFEKLKLIEMGRLYECFETQSELELKRKKQLNIGKPPVYDRTALNLSDKERETLRSNRKGYWRFRLNDKNAEWKDAILGDQCVNPSHVSDPVLIRADGQYLYTLASVIDDIDYGITDIVRGSDHVTNTAVQIQIFEALGKPIPNFAHHSLLVDANGKALSKRDGSLNLQSLRNDGVEPMAIISLLMSLGASGGTKLFSRVDETIKYFKLGSLSRSPAKLDMNTLLNLSQKSLQTLPFDQIKSYIISVGVPEIISEEFWNMAKENLKSKKDIEDLWAICNRKVHLDLEDPNYSYLKEAFSILQNFEADNDTWRLWTEKIQTLSGRKGKDLFQPLRYALTGSYSGPDMNKLLPIMILNGLEIIE